MIDAIAGWAETASPDDFWKVAITLVLLTVACFIGAFYFLIRKRIIQDTPTSKIRSAAQGYVELKGHCELMQGEQIKAPLTHTLCVWFFYMIEEHTRSGKYSKWVTIEIGTSDELFLLIDETGRAVIDPEGAGITPAIEEIWYGHSRTPDISPERKRGNKWFQFIQGRYRYTEQRIHPGDSLYALGLFNTTGGDNRELDQNNDVRVLLKEWKQDSEALLKKFDANKNNKIDMDEWNKVRKAALDQVKSRYAEMAAMPPVNMMNNTRDLRRPYLLSAFPEYKLVKKYATNAGLCITVFFFAGILATWLISIRLTG